MEIKGQYLFLDNQLTSVSDFTSPVSNRKISIYEVVRVIDGIPLFLEDHLARLKNSASLLHSGITISFRKLAVQIRELVVVNNISNGNVKIIFSFPEIDSGKVETQIYLFFIPHKYPTEKIIRKGFTTKTLTIERPEPNAKVFNKLLTEQVAEIKRKELIDEVLLVRHDGIITEGSKSNIFFVRNNKLITAKRNLVLPGITRQKVIELCKSHQIICLETEIYQYELKNMESAFITGTSIKVMPINKIDNYWMDVEHPLIYKIKNLYDKLLENYIKSFEISKLPDEYVGLQFP